jgi:hypothetical protein
VYGQVKTGGMETIPPQTNSKPNSNAFEDLHKVLTLAGHEIDSYNYTHFDTTTITNAQIGAMAFTTSDGFVSSGTFGGFAFIRHYRGTSTDSADRILCGVNSTKFGNSRGRGIAKTALTLRFDAEVYKQVPTITFTYQGKRCYDPRLDATPGADPTNTSFIAWTQCPALCLADYLMSDLGGSYDSADIDWDTVVTAANYCDALVNIPGSTTQKRYTCNGVLFATEEFTDNVKALADSMLGRVIFRDGKWRMYAGSWQTPTFTIQKEDWISGLSIRFEQGKKKRFNSMRTWYVDPTREWQKVESLPRSNSTYKTADGEESIEAQTEQLMCTNEYEAQRKGEFLLRQSRNPITVAGRLPPRMQNIALWDTGTIVFDHLGWSSKTFRAVGIDMNPDGSMDCVFAEEQSGDWTDLDAADYNTNSTSPLPAPNVTAPTEPTSFSATPQINGTILFDWGRPIVRPLGTEFQIIRSTNSANAAVGTIVWQGTANPVPLVMPVSAHWYWVRSVANSQFSPYTPNTFGTLAIPRLEADQTLQNRLCGDAEFSFGLASSLWQSGNIDTALSLINNVSTLSITSYNATGGQFGGFMRLQRRASVGSINFNQPAFFSVNPQNSLGFPYNGVPFAVEYQARFRVNSRTDAAAQITFGIAHRYSDPNTPTLYDFSAQVSATSAETPLGQWVSLRKLSVVEPIDIGTGITSATQHYAFPFAMLTGSGGQVDVDYFLAEALGFVNFPVKAPSPSNAVTLYEHYAMFNASCSSNNTASTVSFPANASLLTGDWRRFGVGRKFSVNKFHTAAAAFIVPSSGMSLRLAGRASVGTVTMVASLTASAVIENVNGIDFVVSGSGLT